MEIVLASFIFSPFAFYHLMSSLCPHFITHFLGPRMIHWGSDESRGFLSEPIELFG